eukprot:3940566-Rhodomonas_salina.1
MTLYGAALMPFVGALIPQMGPAGPMERVRLRDRPCLPRLHPPPKPTRYAHTRTHAHTHTLPPSLQNCPVPLQTQTQRHTQPEAHTVLSSRMAWY